MDFTLLLELLDLHFGRHLGLVSHVGMTIAANANGKLWGLQVCNLGWVVDVWNGGC